MRRAPFTALLPLVLAARLHADPPVATEITDAQWESPTMTAAQAMAGARASRNSKQPMPLNITGERPGPSAVIVGAANASGRFGSFFTTDLYIVNPHPSGTARVNVFGLVANKDNVATAPPGKSVNIPGPGWFVARNIVSQLGISGGAVLLVSVDEAQSTGTSDSVSAWAFTSTPGSAGGRYGVSVHGVGSAYSDSIFDAWTVGANVNAASRTNFGVFNFSSTSTLTVTAKVYTAGGALAATVPLTVPPLSFTQLPLSNFAASVNDGTLWFINGNTGYLAYMVVNDNLTNDANFQLATGW